MIVEFEIYFDVIMSEVQQRLLNKLDTSPEDENWDVVPLAVFVREKDNEDGKTT
jgi:hypothetical protein